MEITRAKSFSVHSLQAMSRLLTTADAYDDDLIVKLQCTID